MIQFYSSFRRILILLCILSFPLWPQFSFTGTSEIQESLERAQVLGSALMIAAHPDDENTAVLAWLARGRHIRTGYLSLTRGEGGQNLLGPEQGAALGVIRTQELLAARKIDGAEQFFTRAVDFGFSKSPKEAIAKWGHDEILSDIVWVIRRFQPDVIILRFSGTPNDGHGHHQASAILGKEAFEAAGDTARFPEQLRWVRPWKAKRLVWNAFSFTPEQEKKAASEPNRIQADVGVFDPVIGRSFGEIAGLSRSQHRSQGMGVALQRGPSINYFAPVGGETARKDLFEGVTTNWSRIPGGQPIGDLLARIQREFSPNHPELILPMLGEAQRQISALASHHETWAEQKLAAVNQLLALCSGLYVDAVCDRSSASGGDVIKVTLTANKRLPANARWSSFTVEGLDKRDRQEVNSALADNTPTVKETKIQVPAQTAYSQPFWLIEARHGDRYVIEDQQLIGRAAPLPVLSAGFDFEIAEAKIHLDAPVNFRYVDHVRGELTRPLEIVPPVAVNLTENVVLFPNAEARRIAVQVRANAGDVSGSVNLEVPAGWKTNSAATAFHLDVPGAVQEISFDVMPPVGAAPVSAKFRAIATVNSQQVETEMQSIAYEHIPPQVIFHPSDGTLESDDVRLLAKSVGYVMGAGDRVPEAIRQIGANVTLLDETDLLRGNLSRFDAIVTGVRAYNVRPDLKAAEPRLLEYVRNGGTLIVQYNVLEFARFGDKPAQPPIAGPYPLQISSERVVDEDSPITITQPLCPLLSAPNKIGPPDFLGWIQERGLYFSNKWDAHYSTVLATHDPGEKDLPGGILYTRYGKGVYIFTAYSWFRELPAGVPGAYRIFANLLSAGKTVH
jgi:LmbE family N-acetylglucosaminyl deacetylase